MVGQVRLGRWAAVALLALAVQLGASAPAGAAAGEEGWPSVRLSGAHAGKQFLAGSEVYVDAEVDDDVFAAGGDVRVAGGRAVDLFLAGGAVALRGARAQDAIMAGGDLTVDGTLAGDLIAAGGNLRLEPGAAVAGDALLAGGRLAIAGRIDGELRAAAGFVRIDGRVGGAVQVAGGRVVLGPTAVVGGDLRYRGDSEIRIAEGARVAGRVTRLPGKAFGPGLPGPGALILAAVLAWLGVLASLVLLAAALIAAFPRLIAGAGDVIALRPWPSLGLGFAVLVAGPVAVGVAMATVVGIPLGVFALLLYALAVAAGLVAAALWLGRHLPWLRGRYAGHVSYGRRLARAAAGLLVLAVVTVIPLIGGLVLAAAATLGLGGVALRGWDLLGGRA